MCGGTDLRHVRVCNLNGLSPRVRGNRGGLGFGARNDGSIPACAGEPTTRTTLSASKWVYPRVCGGTELWTFWLASIWGLSPRVRGNHVCVHRATTSRGSIPACAGEPYHQSRNRLSWPVYPRVCGGTGDVGHGIYPGGVYPRVCGGTPMYERYLAAQKGLIPACAGEPWGCGYTGPDDWVYPPRVRGNRETAANRLSQEGSIPACAGEPCAFTPFTTSSTVYPRVCGGTPPNTSVWWRTRGLSPRVRGNRPQIHGSSLCQRSIPACAGEPPRATRWRRPTAVYPRVCGGTP